MGEAFERNVARRITPAGLDTKSYREVAKRYQLRLYVTNPAIHDPTGATLSPRFAHQLLTVIAYDITIIEEDSFTSFGRCSGPTSSSVDPCPTSCRAASIVSGTTACLPAPSAGSASHLPVNSRTSPPPPPMTTHQVSRTTSGRHAAAAVTYDCH